MNPKFCNISVVCEARFGSFGCFLLRVWRWQTILDCGRLSLSDFLEVLLVEFASMALSMTSESMVLHLPDLAWLPSIFVTWAKFLKPSGFCNVFWSVSPWNRVELNIHFYSSQIIHGVKQCTMCQGTNYHDTTNHNSYFLRLELFWLCDIHIQNMHGMCMKYCKTFDSL